MAGRRKYRVAISGSYGGLNMGDEAILACIVGELRKSAPVEITVFTRDPEDTLKRHRVDRAVPVRSLSRDEIAPEIERLDLFILGGGGILFDAEAKIYLREACMAADRGVPFMTYAIGAGPLIAPENQVIVKDCLCRADVVTVRERAAAKALEDAGVTCPIHVTADPALLLAAEPLPAGTLTREGWVRGARMIGFSVREPGPAAPGMEEAFYHSLLANAADYMIDRYDARVVFIPMERKVLDMQHSHSVISKMLRPQRASVLMGNYAPGQLLTLMTKMVFAVGMRLHFLVFAALAGIPFVGLPYASKVLGFLEDLKIAMPPLQLVNSGRLIAYIDQAWDSKKAVVSRTAQVLPRLQERARETNRFAVELLKKGRGR